jgi:hypothetical protein
VEDFNFAQEITISHDGRAFLFYESRAWILDGESRPVRMASREVGWWRPVTDEQGNPTDDMEATMCTPTGIMELYLGKLSRNGTQLEMETDAIVRSPTAKAVTAGHRLFGIVDAALLYAQDMAVPGRGLEPHLSARLIRIGG